MIDLFIIFTEVSAQAPPVYSQSKGEYGNEEPDCFIFSSSIRGSKDLEKVSAAFAEYPEVLNWSADLDDWEKVLRVECTGITPSEIISLLKEQQIYLEEMLI